MIASHPDLRAQRERIEQIDREIVGLISQRAAAAAEVGRLKRRLGGAVLDPGREASIIRRGAQLARELGLPDEEIREIFWRLVGLCRRVQLEDR